MCDKSCPLKRQSPNYTGGTLNKQEAREEASRATVERDRAPSIRQRSGRKPRIAFGRRKQDASSPRGRGRPIVTALPSWALQQHSGPKPGEEIASPVAGQPHSNSLAFAPLVTIGEAAAALRVAPRTIRRMIERGELHAVRIGRSVRIRRQNIERIISGVTDH
jgi:excisionase family DNA binding protein